MHITITVGENQYCEAGSVDVELLSPIFDSYEPQKGCFVLLRPPASRRENRLRVSGKSTERGGIVASVRCAKVKMLSGEHAGKIGFLLWGAGDAGITCGGAEGWGEPWRFLDMSEHGGLPAKVRSVVDRQAYKKAEGLSHEQ